MKVHELMSSAVVTVGPKMPLRDVLQLMLRHHINNVVVLDNKHAILGIATFNDLNRRLLPTYDELAKHEEYLSTPESMEDRITDVANTPVEDIMTRKVITVSPDLEALKAGATMTAHGVKQLPVVHDHKLVGIITHTDIGWGIMKQYPECLMGERHAMSAPR